MAGHQDQKKTLLQIKQTIGLIKRDEGLAPVAVFSQENVDLVARIWDDKYAHKRLRSPGSMRSDLERAARACGIVSIASGSRKDLQKAINTACPAAKKQRRVVQRVNEMLGWLHRDFRLEMDRDTLPNPRHLLLADIQKMTEELPTDHLKALVWTLFGTGCRFGEAFCLTPDRVELDGKVAYIREQRLQDWSVEDTKTGMHPKAPIIKEASDWVTKWASLSEDVKRSLRQSKAVNTITVACRKAFPDRPDKWCHFHDMRHSYAKHLGDEGCDIEEIAAAIGDSIATTLRYYKGFIRSDKQVRAAVAKLWK